MVLYYFSYKTERVSLPNNPENLDLSYKTHLDFLGCFGRENPLLYQNFVRLIKIFGVIQERENPFL